ncbi:MAG TPA: hypothetical protein VGI40_14930 [Pirellulaceae bacterium]|jgi:hypothetical protein
MMTRRRFAFWIGFGLFNLSETLRAETFDKLAAATMRSTESKPKEIAEPLPVHWTANSDNTWRWYEREDLIDGQWVATGITTPVNKKTGELKMGHGGYLDESLLPVELRIANHASREQTDEAHSAVEKNGETDPHLPTTECRARHGRPPSQWLRSLQADEIRIWLKSINVPEAGVSGMTYWEHLTRDHMFDAAHIAGLTTDEQAKLHAAAHFGY